MSLYDIINNLELYENNNKQQIYSSIKLISNYIKGDVCKFTKTELINITEGLKYYLNNKSTTDNKKWNFKSGSINLDEEQHQIVISPLNQNKRIIAGAGSGKTTTILCRVKYLLDNFICPDRILILTFNRDSAQNIRNRIDDLFGFPVYLNIYTIDAFCCKLMYMYGSETKKNIKSLSEYSSSGLEIMKMYGKEISTQYTHIFFADFQDVNHIALHFLNNFVANKSR